jgi:hypothetical protein
MSGNGSSTLAGLAVAATLLVHPAAGVACGYHGLLGDGFLPMHPRSIGVAFAISDAADEQLLDREIIAPRLADMLALHRATQRLERLRAALQRVRAEAHVLPFALLLVESGMWSRYASDNGRVRLTAHTEPPPAGEAAVVTGDAVLAAIAAGRLTPEAALDRGLIAVDGPLTLAPILTAALAL